MQLEMQKNGATSKFLMPAITGLPGTVITLYNAVSSETLREC